MRGLVFSLTLLLLGLPFVSAHAQINAAGIGAVAQIELIPAYPDPYGSVKATLNDYATDAAGGVVTWRINGVTQKELNNQRTINTLAGAPGIPFKIQATVTLANGSKQSVEKVVTPAYLDIVVEPQTRVPQFYPGRALPSFGSSVNLTAVANAGNTPKEGLVYTWTLNNTVLMGGPIRGQNQVTITMPRGEALVEVVAERPSGGVVASKSVILYNTTPFLHFYTTNALYGMSIRPIKSTLPLIGNSTTVRAEPYYLDLRTYNRPDLIGWNIGGLPTLGQSSNPYEITLAGAPNTVGFLVQSTSEVMQGAESGFSAE